MIRYKWDIYITLLHTRIKYLEEDGVKRLQELETGVDWNKSLSTGHDRILYSSQSAFQHGKEKAQNVSFLTE